MRKGYALVGRTFKAVYFENEEAAFKALRNIPQKRLKFDGNVTIYKLIKGEWVLYYEPPIVWDVL